MRALDEVMRFVDDQQRRPAELVGEPVDVEVHELRRRADDVPRAVLERVHQRGALAGIDRAVGAEDAQAERFEPAHQRFVLIVGQRAQRVEHDRLRAALERADRGRQLEAQRLAAAGSEHGERVASGRDAFEHRALRVAQRLIAEQRALHVGGLRARSPVPRARRLRRARARPKC